MTLKEIMNMGEKLGLKYNNVKARNIYINWLYKEFGFTDMAGLVDDDSPVEVEQMYISRYFSQEEISEETGSHRIEEAAEDRKGTKRDILYWLKKKPFLMIAGLPGAGKTWLVYELALEAGIKKGTDFNRAHPWVIPIPIVLRECDIKEADSLDNLIDAFFDRINKDDFQCNKEHLNIYRRQGQFLILLDGIDEVAPEKRRTIMTWALEAFSGEEIHNHYIVTGRPAGFEDLKIADKPSFRGESAMLHLLPFTDKQKEEYIRKWHTLRPAPSEEEKQTKQKSLINTLEKRDYLITMARRPSFLALICFVHNNLGELPNSRAILYEKIMDAYILQLEKVRNIDIPPWEKLDLVFLLSRLAFDWQLGSDRDDYGERIMSESTERITIRLSRYLKEQNRFRTIREAEAVKLLPFYLARTGILSEPEAGTIRFVHNSFQEYLAAYYLNVRHQEGNSKSFEFLLNRVGSEFWRESAHLFLSLRQTNSQNLAYRTLLRQLNLNKAGQRLFLAEILGTKEVAFSEQERKRWIELLLLAEINGKEREWPWKALHERKGNVEHAHSLMDQWLKIKEKPIAKALEESWNHVNTFSYLGVDWSSDDDPLGDKQENEQESFFENKMDWSDGRDFYLESWEIKASLYACCHEDRIDEEIVVRLKNLDRSLLYEENSYTALCLLIQRTPYYRNLPLSPASLFWRDIFLIIPQNSAALSRYEWLKKLRAYQLLFWGEMSTLTQTQARDMDQALNLDRALVLVRYLDLDRVLALDRDLDLDRVLALDLGRTRDMDRLWSVHRYLDLDRDLDRALHRARALDRDLDLDLGLDLGRALDMDRALDRDRALALDWVRDQALDLARASGSGFGFGFGSGSGSGSGSDSSSDSDSGSGSGSGSGSEGRLEIDSKRLRTLHFRSFLYNRLLPARKREPAIIQKRGTLSG